MLMHIAVVVLVLALSYLAYKNWVGREGERYLVSIIKAQNEDIKQLELDKIELQQNYNHLEIGMDEQADNYEQQFLTFEEHLVAQAKEILELEAYLEKHDRECLPILQETRWQALDGLRENA